MNNKNVLVVLVFALFICNTTIVSAQADGSFFSLKLGDKTALFKYSEQKMTVGSKDSIVTVKRLTLQDNTTKTTSIKYNAGAVPEAYHVETEMSYSDFLVMMKSRFELRNPQKELRVYSYDLYYEAATTGGFITVKYPQTSEGVISKLNALVKGGFILLSLTEADHGQIPIDNGQGYMALIHIRN